MADYADLLTAARVGLPQCPDPIITSALQRAGACFFAATLAWKAELPPIVLIAGTDTYDFQVNNGARVLRVTGANLDDTCKTPVDVVRWSDISSMYGRTGAPRALALMPADYSLRVWPTPIAAANLIVRAALAPTLDADGMPDRLMDDWHTALIAAAKAELQATPDTPWYNQKESVRQQDIYYEMEASAKRDAMSGHGAPLRVRFRPF